MNETELPRIDDSSFQIPWLTWFACAAITVTALSILAAQAPDRIRLLGLFAITVGGVMGAATAFLTKPHPVRIPRWWLAVLALMAVAGLAASTWLTFRTVQLAKSKSANQQMAETMMKQMEQASQGEIVASPTPNTLDAFRWFLVRRLSKVAEFRSPFPEVFWVCELLFGGTAAIFGWKLTVTSLTKADAHREEEARS